MVSPHPPLTLVRSAVKFRSPNLVSFSGSTDFATRTNLVSQKGFVFNQASQYIPALNISSYHIRGLPWPRKFSFWIQPEPVSNTELFEDAIFWVNIYLIKDIRYIHEMIIIKELRHILFNNSIFNIILNKKQWFMFEQQKYVMKWGEINNVREWGRFKVHQNYLRVLHRSSNIKSRLNYIFNTFIYSQQKTQLIAKSTAAPHLNHPMCLAYKHYVTYQRPTTPFLTLRRFKYLIRRLRFKWGPNGPQTKLKKVDSFQMKIDDFLILFTSKIKTILQTQGPSTLFHNLSYRFVWCCLSSHVFHVQTVFIAIYVSYYVFLNMYF